MTARDLINLLQSVDPDTIVLKQDSEWGVAPVRESTSAERVIFSKTEIDGVKYRRDYYPPDVEDGESYATCIVIE